MSGLLFRAVCLFGALTALGLLVHEARHTAPVRAEVLSSARHGLTTTASLSVRNTTSAERCVLLRAVAQDREGRDLGASAATRLVLPPHGRAQASGVLTLTAQQYAERFTSLRAVTVPC